MKERGETTNKGNEIKWTNPIICGGTAMSLVGSIILFSLAIKTNDLFTAGAGFQNLAVGCWGLKTILK